MKNCTLIVVLSLLVAACGSEDQVADEDPAFVDDDQWGDTGTDEELGSFSIDLAGQQVGTKAYCALDMTRMEAGKIATISANFSIRPFDEKAEADWDFGELNVNWGVDPEMGRLPMGINYEPPTSPNAEAADLGWVQDIEEPTTASFSMGVDGESYDFATGDTRDADDLSKGPHLWDATVVIDARLVNPRSDGEALRGDGRFAYEGLCTVSIRNFD